MAFGAGCRDNRVENCELVDLGGGGVKIGHAGGRPWAAAGTARRPTTEERRLAPHGAQLPDRPRRAAALGGRRRVDRPLAPQRDRAQRHLRLLLHGHLRRLGVGLRHEPRPSQRHRLQPRPHARPGRALRHGRHLHPGRLARHRGPRQRVPRHPVVRLRRLGPLHRRRLDRHRAWRTTWSTAPRPAASTSTTARRTASATTSSPSPREHQLQRTRTEPHLSFFFERNIVYWDNASPLLGSNWNDNNFKLDYNVYWNAGEEPIKFPGGLTLDAVAREAEAGRALDRWPTRCSSPRRRTISG